MVNVWISSTKMDTVLVHDVNLIKICTQLFRNKWITVYCPWKWGYKKQQDHSTKITKNWSGLFNS